MANLNFPTSPVNGQTYTANGATWTYNSTKARWYVTNFTNAPTGPVGFTGSRGVTGFTGSQGIQGVTGFTGSQGIQGVIGYTGSQGDIGFTGSQGATGFTGSRGATGFTGSVGSLADGATLRLTGIDDVTLSSTTHPFQIGLSSGFNMAIDHDEIMARNNGAASTLYLNYEGGDITLGQVGGLQHININGILRLDPITLPGSSLLGDLELDSSSDTLLITTSSTTGRKLVSASQYRRLLANGTAFGPAVGTFFGASSSIPLEANGVYEIDWYCRFLKTTAGTATWSFVNSAVVTSMHIQGTMSAITGSGTTGTWAAPLTNILPNATAATVSLPATGSLTTAVNHFAHFRVILENAASTSIRLNVTQSAGTMTPLRGSWWTSRRIPSTNNSIYAA